LHTDVSSEPSIQGKVAWHASFSPRLVRGGDINCSHCASLRGLHDRGHAVHFAVDERFAALVALKVSAADVLPPDIPGHCDRWCGWANQRAFEHGCCQRCPRKSPSPRQLPARRFVGVIGLHCCADCAKSRAHPRSGPVWCCHHLHSTEFAPIPQTTLAVVVSPRVQCDRLGG